MFHGLGGRDSECGRLTRRGESTLGGVLVPADEVKHRIQRGDRGAVPLVTIVDTRRRTCKVVQEDGRHLSRLSRTAQGGTARQVFDFELVYDVTESDGRTHCLFEHTDLRYTSFLELEWLLARAGFEIEQLHGGFDGQPLDPEASEDLVAVATRPSREGPSLPRVPNGGCVPTARHRAILRAAQRAYTAALANQGSGVAYGRTVGSQSAH